MKYFSLSLLGALFLISCASVQTNLSGSSADWNAFTKPILSSYFGFEPQYGAQNGLHQYDGDIADFSEAGMQQQTAWLKDTLAKAMQFTDAQLTSQERFQRDYIVSALLTELYWRDTLKVTSYNPDFYVNRLDPSVYIAYDYAPADVRLKAYLKYLSEVPSRIDQIQHNFNAPLPRVMIDYGYNAFAGYVDFYAHDGRAAFAAVKDAELQRELAQKSDTAQKRLQQFLDWLKEKRATATDNFALGAERYSQMLRDTNGVDVPLATLKAAGQADLAKNLSALKEACAIYAKGKSLASCLDKVRADKPKDGQLAAARKDLVDLKAYILKHDLVSIPSGKDIAVAEAPPYNRQNSAYMLPAAPFDPSMGAFYYIAPPDPTWPKKVQDDFVFGKSVLLNTSVHEVWPGHFLQFLHAAQSSFDIGQVFANYAFTEGWAHYVEQMMWDEGFDKSTEYHVGQLLDALLRDCRFLSSIGLHTEGMSIEASKRLFMDQCLQDEGTAIQQANRGAYDPGYLAYTLGKLMILKLRTDWLQQNPTKTLKDFHDQFLSYGSPQIPLIRRAMLGNTSSPL